MLPKGGPTFGWRHFGGAGRLALLMALLASGIVGCAVWGGLHANLNGENFRIGRALSEGDGFANPTGDRTGPTAWCAPVYPSLFAGLLWLGEGEQRFIHRVIAVLQVGTLIGTVALVLTITRQTSRRLGAGTAAALLVAGLAFHAWYWFELATDCWLVLLVLDLLVAGISWGHPFTSVRRAAAWGILGGLSALVNPSAGLAWAGLSLFDARGRPWQRSVTALAAALLILMPWTVRNYLVFGRWIPIKSNLAYELYQTQCLQDSGLFQARTARMHPSSPGSRERLEYRALGEVAYLDRKREQFLDSVKGDPLDFFDRVAERFFGATLRYAPFDAAAEERRPGALWARRLIHPLPFIALVVLLVGGLFEPLGRAKWAVIGIYGLYLLPYVAASYYERYTVPLLAVKVLLVTWAADRLLERLRPHPAPLPHPSRVSQVEEGPAR